MNAIILHSWQDTPAILLLPNTNYQSTISFGIIIKKKKELNLQFTRHINVIWEIGITKTESGMFFCPGYNINIHKLFFEINR